MNIIYVAGHKSPDLDSVIGTISYAYLKQKTDRDNKYQPTITGELNPETKYVLERFGLEAPIVIDSLAGKQTILVDHNESYQAIDGLIEAEILEVIDHHKMSFDYHSPIKIIVEPIGSSCSVITKLFRAEEIEIPTNLAGAMLAAVLTDTVITKSPTTTDDDLDIIKELSVIAGIEDWQEFGMEIFRVRSSVSEKTDDEVITADYKDFEIGGHKFGIGQVETVDIAEFDSRTDGLLEALEAKKQSGQYHSVILFISDILKEESTFLVSSDEAPKIAEAFGQVLQDNSFTAPVLSRKKQVVPSLIQEFEK